MGICDFVNHGHVPFIVHDSSAIEPLPSSIIDRVRFIELVRDRSTEDVEKSPTLAIAVRSALDRERQAGIEALQIAVMTAATHDSMIARTLR